MTTREDSTFLDEDCQYAHIVNYVGEWAVVTADNPKAGVMIVEADSMEDLVEQLADHDPVDMYETAVVKVGDGTLQDLPESMDGSADEFTYYVEIHDSWKGVQDRHAVVLAAVYENALNLSRSLMEQEIDAMLEWK